MCLIAVAHRVSPEFPLVIAANRDEFYDRPARAAHQWDEDPRVVGGRDLRAGGSWLAVRAGGRFAAITNVRGAGREEGGPSRGELVSRFVLGEERAGEFAVAGAEYAGFHLILGDGTDVTHVTNATEGAASIIEPGTIFAVSNGRPGEDWPKVELARAAMMDALGPSPGASRHPLPAARGEGQAGLLPAARGEGGRRPDEGLIEQLLAFLTTRRGGPLEEEVFVVSPHYGTRCSTVIVVDRAGAVTFVERTTAPPGGGEVRLRLRSPS